MQSTFLGVLQKYLSVMFPHTAKLWNFLHGILCILFKQHFNKLFPVNWWVSDYGSGSALSSILYWSDLTLHDIGEAEGNNWTLNEKLRNKLVFLGSWGYTKLSFSANLFNFLEGIWVSSIIGLTFNCCLFCRLL